MEGQGCGETDPLAGVSNYQDKATSFSSVFVAQVVETGQGYAVLLQRVDKLPIINELDSWRHKQANLFCQRLFQQATGQRGAISVTSQGQGSQGWRLEGRETAFRSVEQGGRGAHGAVVICGQGTSEGCGSFVCAEAAEEATEGVGNGVCDVVEEAGLVGLDLVAATVPALGVVVVV
jgi:hypothetical protein